MADYSYKLPAPEVVALPGSAARLLVQEGNGAAALLYIYILSGHAELDRGQACRALHMTADELDAAAGVLVRLGLLEQHAPAARPQRADELPEYTAEDVTREIENGTAFRSLIEEVQTYLGKILSQDDLLRLFGIYDALGFPPEVIVLLVSYCAQESQRRYGPGRRPTMRQIEKTAYVWEREGLFSLELAERYIRSQNEKHTKEAEFALALRISGRALTATESAYVDEWLKQGFGPDAADIAFDRTVTGAGKLDWKYMNGIFKSWHAKGLHTAAQIQAGDSRGQSAPRGRTAAQTQTPAAPTREELAQMQRLLDEINNG